MDVSGSAASADRLEMSEPVQSPHHDRDRL